MAMVAALPLQAAEPSPAITVFAAASMTNALQDIAYAYRRETGTSIALSFAASSALARQIEAGAPADVFISADQEWMDYLAARKLLRDDTRRDIVGNQLVLIAPAASKVSLAIAPGFAIDRALGDGRLAVGDPATVPAGRYAKSALESLGVWNRVADRLASADNVRAALAFVARDEAPLGVVYATDAQVEKKVRVVGVFPSSSHAPITYPAALVVGARPQAAAFINYLSEKESQAIFTRYGFSAIPATSGKLR